MKILLNRKIIESEIDRIGWNKTRLAHEMKISRQLLNYHLQSRSTGLADKFGKALNIDPKNLIIIKSKAV